MGVSLATRLAVLPRDVQAAWLERQDPEIVRQIRAGFWWWTARSEQLPPDGDWFIWLYMSGRGSGKTRAGAEWLIDRALKHPVDRDGQRTEWLAIAQTLTDARSVMIEGVSGLIACLHRRGMKEGRDFWYRKAPRLLIDFAGGQRIYIDAADNADVGRGYNAAGGWLDEICKWRYARASWLEGIMPSMRAALIDDHPRVFVSTTPKPIKLLIDWTRDKTGAVHLVTGSTFDNRANLSAATIAQMEAAYGGSSIGQQELYGKLLEEVEGALWKQRQLDADRVRETPDLLAVVTSVDPNASGTGDETGLITVGRGEDGHNYVIRDGSSMATGHEAARRAWEQYDETRSDWLVVESNFGKAWLLRVLGDAYQEFQKEGRFPPGGDAPIRLVNSREGKRLRAQPVASRHEQHRSHLVGAFVDLEDQLTTHDFSASAASPDRMDALVQAELFLQDREMRSMPVEEPGSELLTGVMDLYEFAPSGFGYG